MSNFELSYRFFFQLAFILAACRIVSLLTRRLRQPQVVAEMVANFLLPLFFVYSGLNTRIALLNTPLLWFITLLVLSAACFGKGIACWLAARWNGESQRDAMAVGTLMKARGLMELILLNIGLDRGIITPTLFTIMVMMAIVTTLMTSPIFHWVHKHREEGVIERVHAPQE